MVTVEAAVLLPVLAPAVGAVLVLVLDIAVPSVRRLHYALALGSLVIGAVGDIGSLGAGAGEGTRTLCLVQGNTCFYTVTGITATLQLAALLAAAVTLLLAWPRGHRGEPGRASVSVALLLAATSGAVGVSAARDLGSWLVTLELATLPVVALVALPGTRRAIAGAVQLLTTSLVSFAMLALAAACWFAATGSPSLLTGAAATAQTTSQRGLLALSVVLVLAGVGFKLSLVPFHAWTPTAYVGAPLPVAAFLAGVSKIGALGALLVVLGALSRLGGPALVATAALAVASMTLGNIMALRQDDVVRLLAWSTVAQAGWVVLPLVSISSLGVRGAGAYLVSYLVATLVAFTVVAMTVHPGALGAPGRQPRAARRLTAYRGLLRSSPLAGAALVLALTSLAGIPPGLLGLIGKVVALRPVLAEGWWVVGVLAAVNAVLGVAVYLRWLRVLLEPAPDPDVVRPRGHISHTLALAIGVVALVALSVQPQLFLGPLG